MAVESTNGLGTFARYGAPVTQEGLLSGGQVKAYGSVHEAVVYINGDDFTSGAFNTQLTIPAGAVIREVVAEVTEVFALGGTTPTINVGTDTSEGTNYGIELSEAQAEALGRYDGTPAGTWASPLAADTVVGVALDGTTPTVTAAGACKVVIRYSKI
jgi:hypothetical protein